MSSDTMDGYVKGEAKEKGGIASVAFGDDYSTFFLVYKNGGWRYSGDIPSGLLELLQQRKKSGDLKCVTLGSQGQWFLEAKNGRMWWGGLASSTLNKIREVKDSLKFLDFGTYDADEGEDLFIARYS